MACLRALRPQQWVKNLLLVVPVLTAHRAADAAVMIDTVVAFIVFSMVASGGYLINDLRDREADGKHPVKRFRPIASGQVSPAIAIAAAIGLIVIALSAAWFALPRKFSLLTAAYLVATLSYSLGLKRRMLVDIMLLAGLYTLRILAGGAATGIEISFWLLAFSMFVFLSLAMVKRYAELRRLMAINEQRTSGRGYHVIDIPILRTAGVCSGYLAILVFCLYINEAAIVTNLYPSPQVLWFCAPVMLYWVTRVWFVAERGAMHEDPIVFALTDRITWVCGVLMFVLLVAASWPTTPGG